MFSAFRALGSPERARSTQRRAASSLHTRSADRPGWRNAGPPGWFPRENVRCVLSNAERATWIFRSGSRIKHASLRTGKLQVDHCAAGGVPPFVKLHCPRVQSLKCKPTEKGYRVRFAGCEHHRFKKNKAGERTRLRKKAGSTRGRLRRTTAPAWATGSATVHSAQGGRPLLTIIVRSSRYTCMSHVQKLDVEHVSAATKASLKSHRGVTRAVTNDNGHELVATKSKGSRLQGPA